MISHKQFMLGHIVPFAVWIGVILLLQGVESVRPVSNGVYAWSYVLKSAACAGLFFWFKPWHAYPALQTRHLPLAFVIGVGVAIVWILPETPWVGKIAPAFQLFYNRWLILMPGVLPDYFNLEYYPALPPGHRALAFAPEALGWGMTIAKWMGSACVIAVIEEFFFRGFFYRWLRKNDFWTLSLRVFDAQAFWIVALVFGLEHDRWVVGILAGVAYGWLTVRTGNIWSAAVAHGLTNLILGGYVILSRQYGFW